MDLYTYQLEKTNCVWAMGIPYIDSTVKSGHPLLAPTWDIVMGVKSGKLSPDQYNEVYWAIMRERYHHCPEFFDWIISHKSFAFGCYCQPGKFCHRHELVKFFSEITEVKYCGEITR